MPLPDDLQDIYQRLLLDEPDAPSDLIELALDPLIKFLHSKYHSYKDPTVLTDIAIDSLFKFVQQPNRYNPDKSNLWSYLCMDVLSDMHNALDKEQRRASHEIPLDSVADHQFDRNNEVEELVLEKLVPLALPPNSDMDVIMGRLRNEITDPIDWQIIGLWCDGERKTEIYAEVLGITHLSLPEQTKIVKKNKDRLRVQLKRLGVKLNEK